MVADDILKRAIVVIPARGGSVRIPRKNLCPVDGKPLIWYTFEYVRALGKADSSWVVTDDDEILEYSKSEGLNVVREPLVTTNESDSDRAVSLAVSTLDSIDFEYVVKLLPTQPMRPVRLFRDSLRLLARHDDAEIVVSVSSVPTLYHPRYFVSGRPGERVFPQEMGRSELFEDVLFVDGVMYVYRRHVVSSEVRGATLFQERRTFGVSTYLDFIVDIDHASDLAMFDLLVKTGWWRRSLQLVEGG